LEKKDDAKEDDYPPELTMRDDDRTISEAENRQLAGISL